MNAQEKKYTLHRLTEEADRKKKAITSEDKYNRMGLTSDQKEDLIRQGAVAFTLPDCVTEYTRLFECYDFSPFNNAPALRKEMEQRVLTVHEELMRIKDIIMLGEASDALVLINEFVAKSF